MPAPAEESILPARGSRDFGLAGGMNRPFPAVEGLYQYEYNWETDGSEEARPQAIDVAWQHQEGLDVLAGGSHRHLRVCAAFGAERLEASRCEADAWLRHRSPGSGRELGMRCL